MNVFHSKKYFLLFLASFFGNTLPAQEFSKAPVPKVKQIIEWVQKKDKKKAEKGFTYTFDKKGKLLKFESLLQEDFPIRGEFEYDKQGRKTLSDLSYGARYETTEYVYKKNSMLTFFYYRGDEFKTFYFYDEGHKLTERKTFLDSMDQDKKYVLTNREIYNYNSKDSLIGVKHYTYQKDYDEPFVGKTIHQYDPKTGKRVSTKHIGLDDGFELRYTYNGQNKLIKKTLYLHDKSKDITTYEYKKGQLWLETFISEDYVIKKIYKNGRLIRKRSEWMGQNWEIVDYQYIF